MLVTLAMCCRACVFLSTRGSSLINCFSANMPDAVKYALMGHALGKGEGGKGALSTVKENRSTELACDSS